MVTRQKASDTPVRVVSVFLVALAVYGTFFFRAVPDRAQALLIAVIPDQILLAWIDGDLGNIGLLDRMFVALFAGLILLLAWGIGRQTLRLTLHGVPLSRLEDIVFSIAMGLSELSLVTLLIGLAGGYHHWAWLFVSLVGIVVAKEGGYRILARRGTSRVCHGEVAEHLTDTATEDSRCDVGDSPDHGWVLWILAAPFLVLILLGGMMPPWEFDVREYHLQVPKEWYQAGGVHFLPHNVYGNMPLGAEMHVVLGMILTATWADWWWGALVGKTVMASFAPLTALGLFAVLRRYVSKLAAGAAAVVYLSTPWVMYVSITGLNEGAVGCYALMAVAAMLIWQDRIRSDKPRSGTGVLFLAGLFAGSAAACKYPALLFVVVPLAVWAVMAWKSPILARWDVRLKSVSVFLLAALVTTGPWYAKNLVFTGNPVYPLVFGGATRTPELMERWNRAHQVPRDHQGRRYSASQAADSIALLAWRSPWISPLVLPLAVLAWLNRRHRRRVIQLSLLIVWVLLVWWLATHRVDRFLVPILPWAVCLVGIGFAWSCDRLWRRVAWTVLIVGVTFHLLYFVASGHYDRRLLVSLETLRWDEPAEPDDPSRVSLVHRYMNRTVPDGKRVLLVGDAQPFDLEVPAVYSTCFDPCNFELWMRDRTAEQRRAELLRQRISHVYFDWGEIARYRSPGNYGFSDWVTRDLVWNELVHQQGLLRLVPLEMDPARGELFEVVAGESEDSAG
ncbi:MAG: hypothetical protein EA424_05355 [Planctomycetaceae bacterium]|nr:MAG: hypothetical protein EA424_05355 [Planctomycetaceae bacterium]